MTEAPPKSEGDRTANREPAPFLPLSEWTGEEAFRDSIGTLYADGKRKWIYPFHVTGPYLKARSALAAVLLAFLVLAPFVEINGHPFLLFNFFERKFVLLGFPFWPQDFFYFVLAFLSSIVMIVVVTVAFGRVFCGWICPQTIFMEHVFRRMERWIEGEAPKRKTRDAGPWTLDKIWRKTFKHSLFGIFSFGIANIFLAYLIGKDKLMMLVTHSPLDNWMTFVALVGFSITFYFVFAQLREQACIAVCPYGRLQGVLMDRNSVVIAYDYVRGEPRGKLRKNQERTLGDCIDCFRCVQVCPTGIDIRNGTQLECINCTACMDACDDVMVKIGKPKGLVRMASMANIADSKPFRFTKRLMAYTVVLAALLSFTGAMMVTRQEVAASVQRKSGTLYRKQPDGSYSNFYTYELINKTFNPKTLSLHLVEPKGIVIGAESVTVKAETQTKGTIVVTLPSNEVKGLKTPLTFVLRDGDREIARVKSNFTGPIR